MNNELMIFEGHDVEIFELNGQVLFNPRHVADCLDISDINSSMRDFNEKQVVKVFNSDIHTMHIRILNNAGENYLTESGVYKLIFKSRKPEAEKFQDWVADEVLPSIRKTGNYNILQSKYVSVCNKNEKLIETYNLLAAEHTELIKDNNNLELYGKGMDEINEEFRIECDKLSKSLKKCNNVIEKQAQSNKDITSYAEKFAGLNNPSHCQARIFLGTKDGMFEIKNFELLKIFAKPSYYTTIGAIDWIHKMFKTESPGFYNEIYTILNHMSCKNKNIAYMRIRHNNVVLFHPHIVKKFLNNLLKDVYLFSKFRRNFS